MCRRSSTALNSLERPYVSLGRPKYQADRIAIVVGMIVMMWPALTKVQYEKLPKILTTKALWEQLVISLVINWIIGPFVSAYFQRLLKLHCSKIQADGTSGDASLRLGGSTRPADLPNRGYHGRSSKVYRHGHDLEYTCWWRREPMCYHRHCQFAIADCPVLAICRVVHQCHLGGKQYWVTVW